MKNYNPYRDELFAKLEQHRKTRLVVEQLQKRLEWYESFSSSKYEDDAGAIRSKLSQARIRFYQEKSDLDIVINNINTLEANVSSRLNPKSLFDKSNKKNRKLLSELKEVLKNKECSLEALSREVSNLTCELDKLEPVIAEY